MKFRKESLLIQLKQIFPHEYDDFEWTLFE